MYYIATIIVIANILSVIYAANNNRHTWFIGLIATVLTTIVFFEDKHFMSFLYNLYSSIMCLAGIICWEKNKKDNERSLIRGNITISVCANIILFVIIYLIDAFVFNSNNSILDSIGTSTAILGTYLLVKKDINSWYFWIVGDIAYCALSFANDDYKYILIYGTLLICAIYGCVKNHKLYNKKFYKTSC